MAINLKNTRINDTPVEIPNYVAGHLLWEAMGDFRKAYEDLTNLAHRLSVDAGGSATGGDALPTMAHFTTEAEKVIERMKSAIKRADMFSSGEIYDELIDRTLLGPSTNENGRLRRVYVDDKSTAPTTFVYGENTGMHVFMGVNPETASPQPFVIVSTEDVGDRYLAENGEPILSVSLNDATLYDREKE